MVTVFVSMSRNVNDWEVVSQMVQRVNIWTDTSIS